MKEGWQKVVALPEAGEGWPSFRGRRTGETEPGQLESLQQVQGKDPRVLFGHMGWLTGWELQERHRL